MFLLLFCVSIGLRHLSKNTAAEKSMKENQQKRLNCSFRFLNSHFNFCIVSVSSSISFTLDKTGNRNSYKQQMRQSFNGMRCVVCALSASSAVCHRLEETYACVYVVSVYSLHTTSTYFVWQECDSFG